jgi:hypothetical protein
MVRNYFYKHILSSNKIHLILNIVKLIQLYSGLPGETRLLLQHLKSWTDEYGEPPVNSQPQTTIIELKKLFGSIQERCQEPAPGTL